MNVFLDTKNSAAKNCFCRLCQYPELYSSGVQNAFVTPWVTFLKYTVEPAVCQIRKTVCWHMALPDENNFNKKCAGTFAISAVEQYFLYILIRRLNKTFVPEGKYTVKRERYLSSLDSALTFAAINTDEQGRMVVDGEIDTKDSGWLVLGGVIRGVSEGWNTGRIDLKEYCRRWTLASVRVDDVKSAWTTFALLLCFEFTRGEFRKLFSRSEMQEITSFFRQLDMRFLLEASRNYQVAAAVIDILRVRYGFCDRMSVDPLKCIDYMLAGYLGDGFFNDDDSRGDNRDRRIDAYSAEIIGLLLHYDEICDWNSPRHTEIMNILKDFCNFTLLLVDQDGEFAKWGRSLRGEAEVKKVFLWEFAQKENITPSAGAVSERLFSFFLRTGMYPDGRIGRDKAFDNGIWDEYTTCVQAQGYGIYGLAMALRFASDSDGSSGLPSQVSSYAVHLPGPDIICGNDCEDAVHYVLPAANRLTKNMFFWHNRITGENDVFVDVSAKFMPLPYFGRRFPAPYSGPEIPFLPMLKLSDGTLLVSRNTDPDYTIENNTVRRVFEFCPAAEYLPCCGLKFSSSIECRAKEIIFDFDFSGAVPEDSELLIHLFYGINRFNAVFNRTPDDVREKVCAASIYGKSTAAECFVFKSAERISYTLSW